MFDTLQKPLAKGRCNADGRLVEADGVLHELQIACGGSVPGDVAIPELAALIAKTQKYGFRISRQLRAFDGENEVTAWVELVPHFSVTSSERENNPGDPSFSGVKISVHSWQSQAAAEIDDADRAGKHHQIDKHLAQLTARLDDRQQLLSIEADAPDLVNLAQEMNNGVGKHWADFVQFDDSEQLGKTHWRLLNGLSCRVAGSSRTWRVHLDPVGFSASDPSGFLLFLTTDEPTIIADQAAAKEEASALELVANDLSPVLRQPITRIIANAETIQTKLAGPIADEYSEYASDIASAASHLLNLVDDLGDLEAVEDMEFSTAPDRIDLAELARRAAGILRMRASEKGITIAAPPKGVTQPGIGEFRRVLQILLNLLGNAIRYSPEQSQIWICLDQSADMASITIADQGGGLSEADQPRVFDKFERLGRSGDGGSGLGLYISRKIARAMGGDLTVESAPGQGARFTLSVPHSD